MSKTPFLKHHQKEALSKMYDGCLLKGNRLYGKTSTALYYYFQSCGGYKETYDFYHPMDKPVDLYIITSAEKRNNGVFETALQEFHLSPHRYVNSLCTMNPNVVLIDSWNNVEKYSEVENAFFIFDGNRVSTGSKWAKAFLKITKSNRWIMMTDCDEERWENYIPVFIANGHYKNKTEFLKEHVVFEQYAPYPRISHYKNETRLRYLRDTLTVDHDIDPYERKEKTMSYYDLDSHIYDTRAEAEAILKKLRDLASYYGCVYMADLAELIGVPAAAYHREFSWTTEALREAGVLWQRTPTKGWIIGFPPAKHVSKLYNKPTDNPLSITIDTNAVDDPDEIMADVFQYIYTIKDRPVNLFIK